MSTCSNTDDVQFEEDHFGLFTDQVTGQSTSVRRFTWKNRNNVSVQVVTYGATITSIRLPDRSGKVDDVALGFDDVQGKWDVCSVATLTRTKGADANSGVNFEFLALDEIVVLQGT